MNVQLTFTDKEITVIELMAPPLTATEICNKVMRDWFNNSVQRMHKEVKNQSEILDEIIAKSKKKGVV